jgi:uroporphyrinogen decarboxylase
LDWNIELGDMRKKIPPHIALQGNLDPDVLYAPSSIIRREVNRLLDQMHQEPGYIFNLGHGIHPDVSPEAIRILVETVRGLGE